MFLDFEKADDELELKELQEAEQDNGLIGNIIEGIKEFVEEITGKNELQNEIFENLDKEGAPYTYNREVLPDGTVRETIVWESQSEVTEAAVPADDVYTIEDATDLWHVQAYPDTCAVVCQEFIIEEYTGVEIDETDLATFAYENGWYESGFGTPLEDVGNILNAYGIDTSVDYEADYFDLVKALENGDRAIVAVYNYGLDNNYYGYYPAGGANHAVEVIGIDSSDPENVKVIVNDPGVEDGCGKAIDYDVFMDAWGTSGGFMVVADRP